MTLPVSSNAPEPFRMMLHKRHITRPTCCVRLDLREPAELCSKRWLRGAIACSNGDRAEVLGGGGLYFEPTDAMSIAHAIRNLLVDPEVRARCADAAFRKAADLSWERCAGETWSFLADVLTKQRSGR
jgi:hypothetical protein